MELVKKLGVRPPSKIPYGLEDEYNRKLDELMEDCRPIDGHELMWTVLHMY